MNAEIITIGDEILIGQIIDTNSAFLGKELNKIGASVYQITSIQDDKAHILKALAEAEANADIIIITGGLGPTKDDITKHTLCEYFDDELVENKDVLQHIEVLFSKYISSPISDVNRQQALVPSKAKVLNNRFGTAPGMWIEKNGKIFVSLPGVPYEMKALISNQVIPELRKTFNYPYILHKTLLTHGLGESALAARIEVFEDSLPSYIKLAYLPNLGRVRLRLSAKAMDKDLVEREMEKQINLLLPQIEDIFVGYEDEASLEAAIGKQLTDLGKTLAIAESCTGGSIAQSITANAGASKYYKGSVVSYATESKIKLLNVSEDTIKQHSVVSREVVEAMAKGVLELFDANYAISTTGNAGPSKGDADAEVGTVWISIASKGRIYSEMFDFGNHREKVIKKATNKAFEMLQKEIEKK
ncbi:competence/damage-inducible protein A [Winogradskyella immobilis]|uniref:CinA-like protein n=1 Tax=Winogradskyella immobilis TaxID=2816852 RepID=A0ABS8EPP9_9FLAO|nr:competence/damage-inducible protein A [Winogradskyella immobilis]MCC1485143.1 competence/damage-inducible protein A [Winogradskyella immobilis]MCG0017235.1 competence/damage-inducible protein A [Winogradskyella immobilis]